MDKKRLWRTFRMNICRDKSAYIRKAKIFAEFGENSTMSSKVIPLYPELISIGNNVRMAAKVSLIPHDMIHAMLNNRKKINNKTYKEYMGCIRIDDNVFVGACTTILANVHIGSNVIIGAGSLVNKDLEGGFVYAGVPAKKICTFEQFENKRDKAIDYPDGLGRIGDSVSHELSEYLWKRFCEEHDNLDYTEIKHAERNRK